MPQPRITVLMPVYNGENYLGPAIESILNQTYRDFELLIIDDGSTDTSPEICRSYRDRDSRIRLESNGRNLGLIATLNRGLDLAGGDYVARMDCDDISFPERFARQIGFMAEKPEIGICGSWYQKFSDRDSVAMRFPTEHDELRFFLLFDNPFLHSTMIIRRNLLEKHGLRFDPEYKHSEDYEFWARCSEYTRLANMPEVLVRYRDHPDNICHRHNKEQAAMADRVRRRQLQNLGLSASEEEIQIHNALMRFEPVGDFVRLEQARAWLEKIIALGTRNCGIPEERVYRQLSRFWYGVCGKSAHERWPVWRLFRSSPVGRAAEWNWQWKLLLRCALGKDIPTSQSTASP